jgi:hypothetical protein
MSTVAHQAARSVENKALTVKWINSEEQSNALCDLWAVSVSD